jgi:glycosyltransferase involved in cell wall biosynthesis
MKDKKEMEQQLVSIIITFYNAEKFLEQAIESIENQTYKNWELILVDDGSFDKSTQIAKKYADVYPKKVFYIEHDNHINKGISSSRNLGIKNSTGDFVAFLDADDVWLPNKLQEQVQILLLDPEVSMVYGNYLYWWSWQNTSEKDHIYNIGLLSNTIVNEAELIPLFLNRQSLVPCPSSILVRRETFNSILFEDDIIDLYDDQAFYFKVCLENKVYVSDKISVKYRQHHDSICNTADVSGDNNIARVKFLFWFWNYLSIKNSDSIKLKIAVCKELWRVNLISKSKSLARIINLPLKYLLRVENRILPLFLRTKLWLGSKEFKLLSANTEYIWKRSFRKS